MGDFGAWLLIGIGAGFILMALELLAPGVFLFWLGLAALLVGLLSFLINPSWQLQILMFAVFATAAVPLWRRVALSSKAASKSNPFLNKRADARPSDRANRCEFIVGSYYLFESLLALDCRVDPLRV